MSKRLHLLLTAAILTVGLFGCGTTIPQGSGPTAVDATSQATTPEPRPSRTPVQLPSPEPTPTPATCPTDAGSESCQIVLSTANIFGAGQDETPAPAGGGGGTPPTMWEVPAGATTMTVPSTAGTLKAIRDLEFEAGAEGSDAWRTDLTSFGGISGIIHGSRGLFLVGVFLTDEPPSGEGPERLDATEEPTGELAPQIAQTFLIGDGIGRSYVVPDGATRLFLGFADGFLTDGPPGWYANNVGQLAVSVEFATP